MAEVRTETMTVNMGPQHPSTHGVLRLVLELDGETVVSVSPTIGFLHTGIEKTAEQKKWQQVIPLVERMDYLGAQSNSLAFCLSVETLLGLEVPQRVKDIRVLIAELQRISSHLVWFGTHAMEIGAITGMLYAFREREILMNLNEMLAGFRFFPSYIRVGGLREDIPRGFKEAVSAFLDRFPGKLDEYETLITKNPIWLDRTRGVGVISLADCNAWGLFGPIARAAGGDYDVRRAFPYSGYETYKFDVIGATNGDVYDRYHDPRRRDARVREDLPPGAGADRPGGRLAGGRSQGRAAAQGRGLHRDGSADSALPDLLAGLQRPGRRRLRAGRGAARRARLLRGLGRHQPPVARAHALARADGEPGAAQVRRRRDDRRRDRGDRLARRGDGRRGSMSFHPAMPYGTERWHRSERQTLPEGPEFAFTPERRAEYERLAAMYPPEHRRSSVLYALYLAQDQQGYITGNAARHVAEVVGITTADVEDVVSYYVMFHRNPVGKYVLQVCTTLSCALAGAERVVERMERAARRHGRARPTPRACSPSCRWSASAPATRRRW